MPNPLSRPQRRALYDHCKGKTDRVLFFTYANIRGKDDKFCRFLESVVQNDIEMTVLNWGGQHKGNGNKLVFTRKMLKTLDPCDTFIFSDAFDVLYVVACPSLSPLLALVYCCFCALCCCPAFDFSLIFHGSVCVVLRWPKGTPKGRKR